MKNLFALLKALRAGETFLMTGFPFLGAVFASGARHDLLGHKILIFLSGMYLLFTAIYAWNNFFGKKEDVYKNQAGNPPGFYLNWALGLSCLSLFILSFLGIRILLLSILILLVWMAYSCPGGLKYHPVLGTLAHFFAQLLHFCAGYLLLRSIDFRCLLLAAYFSLLFSVGHMFHQTIDVTCDRTANINTGAVHFGIKRLLKYSLLLLVIGIVYWSFLFAKQWIDRIEFIPFFIASIVHSCYICIAIRNPAQASLERVRANYRLLYLSAGYLMLWFKPG